MPTPFHWEVTADDAQFRSTMMSAAQSLQTTAVQMQSQFTAAFSKIQSMVVGLGAVLAGGGMFGEALNKTAALTKEAQSLGRALGVSATEASVLAVALSDIDQSSDAMLTANRAMTRTLREDEEAFHSLGVATRNQNGEYRNALDIILDVNTHLLKFKEGTDRNVEGQKIYKKSWEEIEPILKLTGERMEESKKRAEELGLVVGKEGIEQVHQYRVAMNGIGDVLKAVTKVIGEGVMPVITELGTWFASTGPERVAVMRQAIAVIVAAFYGLKMAVQIVWETIKAGVEQIAVYLLTLAEVAERAMHWDWAGAREAWNRGMSQVADIGNTWMDKIVKDAETNQEKIFAALFKGGVGTAPPGQTSTTRPPGVASDNVPEKGKISKWEAELAEARNAYEEGKILQGSAQQFSKQREAAFWQEKLALVTAGSDLEAQVKKKLYAVLKDLNKEAFDGEIAVLKARMDEEKKSAVARIDIANQIYMKERERHGAGSAQAIRALAEVQKATKEFFQELRALQDLQIEREKAYQLSRVELERANLDTLEQLGQVTAGKKLEALRNLKEIEYQIELKAEMDKAALLEEGTLEYEAHLNRLAALKNKHELDLKQVDGRIKVEQFRVWREIGDAITGAFSTAIKGVIMGTQTLTQAMRNMAQSVLLALIDMAVKWLVQTAANALISVAIERQAASQKIAANAAVAATGAAASAAEIPLIGWIIAAGAAAAVYAMAMSYSAAQGFDVPQGLNPMTQLHEKEMVLPAHIAEPLRDKLASGDVGAAPVAELKVARVGRNFFLMHRDDLAKAMETMNREGYSGARRR